MKTLLRSLRSMFVALSLVALTPACSTSSDEQRVTLVFPAQDQPVDARVTLAEARALAESALEALNDGDYARFIARWDDALKAELDEEAFLHLREMILDERGRFVAIAEARTTPGEDEGVVRFTFLCDFEESELVFYLEFPTDGDAVTGVQLAQRADG